METNIKLKLTAFKYLGLTNIVPSLEQVFKTRLEAAGYKVDGFPYPVTSKNLGDPLTSEAKPNYDTADPKKVYISMAIEDQNDQTYLIDWNIGYRGITIPNFVASATIPNPDNSVRYKDETYGEHEWEGDTELATTETSGYKFWDAHIQELIDIIDTAK